MIINDIIEKLIKTHRLTIEEFEILLSHKDNEDVKDILRREALSLRHKYYGKKVFIRGLIEFTNYCKNNCLYCGIRRDNCNANRYRLTHEEILECCRDGYELGYRTFVLQGGEDPYFTDERLVELISAIKKQYSDCAVTLSFGERTRKSYELLKNAGVDRYLLRHETADEVHYQKLHPKEMSLTNRKRCLQDLKELGYQVGAGMMVGSPGQTLDLLAKDLYFLQQLEPHMVGIGPFIPHKDTCFADKNPGSIQLTLMLLSIVRIILPKVLLPATTALGTLDLQGREKGIMVGCNVVMPNLSPTVHRKDYALYDNKISTGEESAQSIANISERVKSIGYEIVKERGDYAN
ncbi:MAG: [FeFe] hydrogenase H-cluster radical SAM maturase HydE [Lachnospiraceae bacterium]|nr:[FeFe] hydrogenase H-cluster radical SAM maturase HydE [Lachnospiraceae bacterium]